MKNLKYFKERNMECLKCGFDKFKTIIKGKKWQCRKCENIILENLYNKRDLNLTSENVIYRTGRIK